MVGALGQNCAAGVRLVRRRRHASRTIGFHQRAAVGLLVVRYANHEDLNIDPEEGSSVCERGSPLPAPGFGNDAADAGLAIVERLWNRGVRLVAAGRTDTFVLVVDLRRRVESLLQAAGTEER